MNWSRSLGVTASLLFPVQLATVDNEPAPISVGDSVRGELVEDSGSIDARTYILTVTEPGWITVTATSLDFDPQLTLWTPDDEAVGPIGRTETAPLVRLEAEVGPGAHELIVGSAPRRPGEYMLQVQSGRAAPLSQEEQTRTQLTYFQAVAERARVRGDALREAEYAFFEGAEQFKTGDFHSARSALEQALTLLKALPDQEDWYLPRAAAYLGATLNRLEQHQAAVDLFEGFREAILDSGDPSLCCFLCEHFGYSLQNLGRAEDALASFQELGRHAGEGQTAYKVLSMSLCAGAREAMGDMGAARTLHEQAARAATRIEHEMILYMIHFRAGQFLEHVGEIDGALERYEQASGHVRTTRQRLAIEGQKAGILARRGRLGLARKELRRILREVRESGVESFQSELLPILAEIAVRMADMAFAREIWTQTLEKETATGNVIGSLLAREHLAWIEEEEGSFESARRKYEGLLQESLGLGNTLMEARLRIALGRVLMFEGAAKEARAHHETGLELVRQLEKPMLEALALELLASDHALLGQLPAAQESAQAAIDLYDELGLPGQGLYARLTLARVALSQQNADRAERLLQFAEKELEGERLQSLSTSEVAGYRSRHYEWGRLAQDLTALRYAKTEGEARRAAIRLGFERAQQWKGRALLEGIRASSVAGATAAHGTDLVARLSEQLGSSRVLIEYAPGEHDLFVYVLRGGRLSFHRLGSLASLDPKVARFVGGVSGSARLAGVAEIARLGHRLFLDLVDPLLGPAVVRDELDGLVLIPSASLATLPFEALVLATDWESNEDPSFARMTFLLDRFDVIYGPSSAVLAQLTETPPPGTGKSLLMGDVPYGKSKYATLDHARRELFGIANLLFDATPGVSDQDHARLSKSRSTPSVGLHTDPFALYLGDHASVDSLMALSDKPYRIIHLAAHGHVDARDPRKTGIVLSGTSDAERLLGLDDVVRIGLRADLVVLSTCDSAKGSYLKGEGAQSMVYAFLEAGSRSVIATLWEIRDLRAEEAALEFYRRLLKEQQPASLALRNTKIALRHSVSRRGKPPDMPDVIQQEAHPYFWAPYVYSGSLSVKL